MSQSLLPPLPAPRKRFGQHFLQDSSVLARIVAAIAPLPTDHLVEIGPGLGALTLPLLQAVGRLEVVEFDRDLIPHLRARCAAVGELTIHQADALAFDFSTLATCAPLRLVGNLPYNIATPLLFHLLGQLSPLQTPGPSRMVDMHFMLQREVVERLAAWPGSEHYGRLSVMIQYHCHVERVLIVPAGAFRPPPRVESAVVRLRPHARSPVVVSNYQHFAQLVRQAFSQRRKTVRNTLRGLLTEASIQAAGVDPGARPEVLSLAQFARLAEGLTQQTPL